MRVAPFDYASLKTVKTTPNTIFPSDHSKSDQNSTFWRKKIRNSGRKKYTKHGVFRQNLNLNLILNLELFENKSNQNDALWHSFSWALENQTGNLTLSIRYSIQRLGHKPGVQGVYPQNFSAKDPKNELDGAQIIKQTCISNRWDSGFEWSWTLF